MSLHIVKTVPHPKKTDKEKLEDAMKLLNEILTTLDNNVTIKPGTLNHVKIANIINHFKES